MPSSSEARLPPIRWTDLRVPRRIRPDHDVVCLNQRKYQGVAGRNWTTATLPAHLRNTRFRQRNSTRRHTTKQVSCRDTLPPPRHLLEGRPLRRPVVQSSRIEIRAVRPNQSLHLGINRHLIKHLKIAKGPVHLPHQYWKKIDRLLRPVFETNAQSISADNQKRTHAMNRMIHIVTSAAGSARGDARPAAVASLPATPPGVIPPTLRPA